MRAISWQISSHQALLRYASYMPEIHSFILFEFGVTNRRITSTNLQGSPTFIFKDALIRAAQVTAFHIHALRT